MATVIIILIVIIDWIIFKIIPQKERAKTKWYLRYLPLSGFYMGIKYFRQTI